MNLIVNVSKSWGIGKDGDLLVYLKPDMKFFRETTSGGVVILGRKTLASFPGGKPLKNRVNIVLSANPDFTCEDAIVCRNTDEALAAAAGYDTDSVWVIGGSSVYEALLPFCRYALVTINDCTAQADSFFPNLDAHPDWTCMEYGEDQAWEGIHFRFAKYENHRVREN